MAFLVERSGSQDRKVAQVKRMALISAFVLAGTLLALILWLKSPTERKASRVNELKGSASSLMASSNDELQFRQELTQLKLDLASVPLPIALQRYLESSESKRLPLTTFAQELRRLEASDQAFRLLTRYLAPQDQLRQDDWLGLARLSKELAGKEERMSLALAAEILRIEREPDLLKSLQISDEALSGRVEFWLGLPGIEGRERRIYGNAMTDAIMALESGNLADEPPQLIAPSWSDMISGRTGLVTGILVPRYSIAYQRFHDIRGKLIGLQTASSILAFRSQTGEFPKDLTELRQAGFETATQDELQTFKMNYDSSENSENLSLQLVGKLSATPPNSGKSARWLSENSGRLVFRLGNSEAAEN